MALYGFLVVDAVSVVSQSMEGGVPLLEAA